MTESEQVPPIQPISKHEVGFHTLSGKTRGSVVAFHGAFLGGTFRRSHGSFPSSTSSETHLLRLLSTVEHIDMKHCKGEEGVGNMLEPNAKSCYFSFSSSHLPAMLPFSSIPSPHLPKHATSTTAADLPNLFGRAWLSL